MKKKAAVIIVLITLLGAGAWMADRTLKARSHPGLPKFLHQWWVNYPASFAVEPAQLSLQVDPAELEQLEEVVEAARERGVIMPEGNDYVPAQLTFNGETFKAKVRIKGKMSDHVKDDKWSFRVVAKKDKGFLGMQRFSLQHPGTRNYLCDWFYHRLMQGEGVIALRYGFINLRFNDEDLGVYAYEEHFGPELLEHNARLKGPIFRFDPGLFWIHRLNMMQKVRYDEPFGVFEAAAVDGFGGGDLEKDTVQRRYFEEAVARMNAFRRGTLAASEVFDADRIGKRHAILDLVGGHHSMDWSDVKFYFDPVLKRVEPISYESFSAFPIRTLAGSNRYLGKTRKGMDLHDAYFNDPVMFRAYIRNLERVSEKSYLDSVFAAVAPALDSASAILYREFPYKELDRTIYYKNQGIIRRLLDVPKGFHAYFDGGADTLSFTIVPIEGLPMELHGLVRKDGGLSKPSTPPIVPCRIPGEVGTPLQVKIPVSRAGGAEKGQPMKLRYSVLGASVQKELEVFPYAYTEGISIASISSGSPVTEGSEPLLRFDEAQKAIMFVNGQHELDHDLVIPSGYTLQAVAPLRIHLRNGARIISGSPVSFKGSQDMPIVFTGGGARSGVFLVETEGMSEFKNFRYETAGEGTSDGASIVLQEADARFVQCDLGGTLGMDLLLAVRSDVEITSCTFTGGRDQLILAYCRSSISRTAFNGAGDDALTQKGGGVKIDNATIAGARGRGIKVDEFGEMKLEQSSISSIADALAVSEAGTVKFSSGSLSSLKGAALDVDPVHARHGASVVELTGVRMEHAVVPLKIGAGNRVVIDGTEQLTSTDEAAR